MITLNRPEAKNTLSGGMMEGLGSDCEACLFVGYHARRNTPDATLDHSFSGRSIYEIKEMMGHENIQSTQRYLHIHTELMRKVIFDETLC